MDSIMSQKQFKKNPPSVKIKHQIQVFIIRISNIFYSDVFTGLNSKHVQEKLAHDLKHSKDNMEHGQTKVKTTSHHEQYPEVIAYKLTDDAQDGPSHIPKGAILSLTLGTID